jgi:hypothetical protein
LDGRSDNGLEVAFLETDWFRPEEPDVVSANPVYRPELPAQYPRRRFYPLWLLILKSRQLAPPQTMVTVDLAFQNATYCHCDETVALIEIRPMRFENG